MATAKRFSYSLLISTLAFAVFAAVPFSGLFPWVEAQFYSPKVVSDFEARLDKAGQIIDGWKSGTLGKLDKLLADGAFDQVLNPTASRDDIQKRFQTAKLFLLGLRGGGTFRILSADRTQIHFSTEDADVKARGQLEAPIYHFAAEVTGLPDLKAVSAGSGTVQVFPDADGRNLWFLRPWKPSQGTASGFALLSVSLEDLRLSMVESGLALADQPLTVLAADEYLFSLLGRKTDPVLLSRVKELRAQGVLPPVQKVAVADGQVTVALVHRGSLSLLVPTTALELDPFLKGLLLVSFYTVLFLLAFLLLNLRGEPLSAVTRKVKRFQLQVVRQYLDLKERDKIQSLRDELALHSDEIRTDIRRSLGPVRRRDREWVDRYIDTSWQEVMDLLRGPAPPTESSSTADWKRLETLLQQALTQGRFVASEPPRPAPRPAPVGGPRVPVKVEELEQVEDLDVEEAEEAEEVEDAELVEEAEALDEADELEEAEAVDELEDAGEVEAVEEVEPVEEAEELEEAEAVEEAESEDDVEELEELEDAEAADDSDGQLEDLPGSDTVPGVFRTPHRPAESGPMTELSADDDAEELDELEEVMEELEDSPDGEDFSYSLERLDAAWTATAAGVFDEDEDVVTLKDEVFEAGLSSHDEFGALVDDVLAGPDGSGFLTLDEEDLVPAHLSREWRWTGGGFDWDRFALGNDEVNLFRALSEIVTEFDAFTAAILTEQEGRWIAQSSVGFSDSGKAVLDFGPESPLSKSFLSIRALHVLKGGTAHPALRESFHAKDMKFLKAILCVPLLFRREPAWLLLGLRREPVDLMSLLAPRRLG
jgi:hypothetical protein